MHGICTIANDRVYDQLVALLNSIEAILGTEMPVCVYPYDDRTERIAAEIARRPNVELYQNLDSIARWDGFARSAWDAHPTARERWRQIGSTSFYRSGSYRRYCAFDGPFERFLYMDADTLLMSSPEPIFNRLDESDWVVYDFQHRDPSHVYDLSSSKLAELFSRERIESEIFCAGFYASKQGLFGSDRRDWLIEQLSQGEAEVLYPMSVDQSLLNYMVMRSGIPSYNFALALSRTERTGNSVTSSHFEEKDGIVYDRSLRLTYLHYIGISSEVFTRLCAGENIDFPYRETFLHYRYLHEPDRRPKWTTKPKPYNTPPILAERLLRKLGLKL
ncbi:MAG: sugar transferase [Oscillatoria sp. SIO1A7]|nr:sugar transferase [Oscillatoria sp. SIO1A7]